MKLFGIIGWKNNGKTTLVENLIRHLTQRGYKVASIKHAHHQLDLDKPGRDSFRHRQAGATETLLATQHRWALLHEYRSQPEANLTALTQHFSPCDFILVEGYKQGKHPKLEVVRHLNEQGLLYDQVPQVTAIATDIDQPKATLNTDALLLDLNHIDAIADWVLQQLGIHAPAMPSPIAHQQPLGAWLGSTDTPQRKQNEANAPTSIPAKINNDCYSPHQGLLSAHDVWHAMAQSVLAHHPANVQALPLHKSHNHYLAKDVISPSDSPRFDNAAVDGWALCFADVCSQINEKKHAQSVTLPIMKGQASAGDNQQMTLLPGHCVRISTGARMPQGADTVVMQEDVSIAHGIATLPNDIKANSHWRSQGEDVRTGTVILQQGKLLRPQDIGLAAAAGYGKLPVYAGIKVALFSTGNEIHEVPNSAYETNDARYHTENNDDHLTDDNLGQALSSLPENGIYDVNRHMLQTLFADLHCEVTDLGILEDDYETIHNALAVASQSHQLIITSGGASTGEHDHIAQALRALGEIKAWRVAIKPGRPLAFGNIGKAMFLGLPGNPVAAYVCSLVFGAPLVRALQGGGWKQPKPFLETIDFTVKKQAGRREWLRVYRERQDDGSVFLKRSASHGSGILTSLTKADGLVELDEATTHVNCGDKVRFFPFSGFGIGQLD